MAPERPSEGFGEAGLAFHDAIAAEFDLNPSEAAMLVAAAQTLDEIAALKAVIESEGVTVAGSKGQPVLNPCLPEIRQARMAFHRLVAAIGLPEAEAVDSPTTTRARRAASARWGRVADLEARRGQAKGGGA